VAAHMVGLNHEIMRELLWREYPSDQRGTPFHRFWGRIGDQPDDIGPVHQFAGSLADTLLNHGQDEAVLLLRSELLRRYPGSIIYLCRAPVDVHDEPVLDDTTIVLPSFRGDLPPDVSFVGFPVTPDVLRVTEDPATVGAALRPRRLVERHSRDTAHRQRPGVEPHERRRPPRLACALRIRSCTGAAERAD
jgi:hypothetical protein